MAKPAKRSGCSATARASASLASRASGIAVSGSRCCTPGVVWLMTCRSMPASSMAASRRSPRSARLASSGVPEAASGLRRAPIARAMSGVQKWSSRLMTRMRGIFAIRCARGRRPALRPTARAPQPRDLAYVVAAMTRAGVLAVAVLVAAALAPPARASFGAPVQLAAGSYGIGVAADTDAAGSTTALVSGYGHGPRLFERPSGGAWSAADAAARRPQGHGRPGRRRRGQRRARDRVARRRAAPLQRHRRRHARSGRDARRADRRSPAPTPAACAIRRSRSTRPATRCWPTTRPPTRSTSTCAARSRSPTAAAAARSRTPTVVDATPSSAPAVALGRDGTGVVAWTHDRARLRRLGRRRRQHRQGQADRLARRGGAGSSRPPARAGRRRWRGSATARAARCAARAAATSSARSAATAGHAFAAIRTVASTSDYVRSRQHRRRRGRPGDAGLGPRALRRRSLGGQQRHHERGPRDHCAGRRGRFPAPQVVAAGGAAT